MMIKEALAALADKDAFAVVPSADDESAIALEWLRRNSPKTVEDGRVYEEFEIASLQRGTTIVFVYRDPAKPVEEWLRDGNERVRARRQESELLAEVRASEPLKVSAYWRQEPMRPGKVDVPGLLEHAGKQISPYRLAYSDAASPTPSTLRMRKL